MSPGQHPSPADLGKAGCSSSRPPPPRLVTPYRKAPPEPLTTPRHPRTSLPLPPGMIRSRAAASRAPTAPATPAGLPPGLDPPARSQDPAAIRAGSRLNHAHTGNPRPHMPQVDHLRSPTDTGKADRRVRRQARRTRSVTFQNKRASRRRNGSGHLEARPLFRWLPTDRPFEGVHRRMLRGMNSRPVLAPLGDLIRGWMWGGRTSRAGYGPVSVQPETALSHSSCTM